MKKLVSKINLQSEECLENKKVFDKLLGEFKNKIASVNKGGSEKAIEKHKERGKLLARERIDFLLDKNTPFLELSTLAANGQYDDSFPSAGIVTGIGRVVGREVIIVANDATVKGGTYVKETIKKHLRAQEIALENNLPCIYLVDSGGVFLPEQANIFPDKNDFGRIFYNQAKLSASGIPQISAVMGSCTAGGAYVPAMSDEAVIVRNQGTIFIGGPPLVKAATGEIVTAEELGGGEVHTGVSGVADHLAEDDIHACQIIREIVSTFKETEKQKLNTKEIEEPDYDISDLYTLAPVNLKKPVDAYEIIARLVDGSKFHEFKERYGKSLITGFAHVMGFPVGILANNGVLFSESALKGAHFVELCNERQIPLVFLQNITGFIVGKEYEHGGIAKDGAKMIHAVANANVPKFTIVTGGSFGAGNYAMAGRAYNPRLLFMWPNAKISVMGGEQAASVLIQIKEEQYKKQKKNLSDKQKDELKNNILKKYEFEGSSYFSTSRLWDDGIIDPVDTRKVLAMGISSSLNRKFGEPNYGIFRM